MKEETKINYRSILSEREYCKLVLASIINRFGDSIDAIAMSWLVYQISNNPALSTIVYGVNFLPTILLQPFTGAIVENLSKKTVMVICDLFRGILVALIAGLYLTSALKPWMLVVITFLLSTFEAFRLPAERVIIPSLLPSEKLAFGLSLSNSLSRIMEIVGSACAGIIIASLGIDFAIFIDAVSFFISALIIVTIKTKTAIIQSSNMNVKQYFINFKAGWSYVITSKQIIAIIALACAMNALIVPFNSLQAVLVRDVYHMGSELISLISIAITLGLCLGSLIYPYIARKVKLKNLLYATLAVLGVYYVVLITLSLITTQIIIFYSLIFSSSFALGLVVALANNATSILIFAKIDQNYMSRASSILAAFSTAAMPVVAFILTFVIKIWDIRQVFMLFGILVVGLTIFVKKRKVLDIL